MELTKNYRIETVLELELASSTSSDQSLAFVKNWIKSCRDDHPQCRTNADFNLPTRLIKIHEEGIRLWTPGDTTEKHDYATLSHCWGALETLKVMKSNVEALSSNILLASLCKTFQDAVLVTRSLGYRFLWIDSLCIVQDDEDDWRRESALMSEVYGNAVVNLAATDAEDGSGGLFRQRVVTRISRQYVQTKSLQTFELPDGRLYFRCLDKSLLSRRAWVFQERYLARRTIHFSAEQIFCECRCQIVCEGYPNGAPVRPSDPDDIPFPRKRNMADPEKWRDIIQLYTRAQLTYPEDKLVALSGVARQFQSLNDDQYVAGMWRTGLELYLCWRVERSSESRQLAAELGTSLYRAPSWSWASTDLPITWILYMTPLKNTFDNTNLCFLIDILDIDLVPAGPDPLGQLQNASLDVQCGPLIRGSLIVSLLNDFERPFDKSYKIHLDDGKTFLLRGEGQIHTDLESKYQNEAENLYFLPILIDTNTESMHYRTGVTMYGLVVTRANSDRPGLFKRYGVWEIIFNVGSYTELMKPFLTQPDTLMDESLYGNFLQDEEDGIHNYSITLV